MIKMTGQYCGEVYQEIGSMPSSGRTELFRKPESLLRKAYTR